MARRSSTAIAPVSPRRTPAWRASSTSGSTPMATTQTSTRTSSAPARIVTPESSPRRRSTARVGPEADPVPLEVAGDAGPHLRVEHPGERSGPASTRQTSAPQSSRKASASSHPSGPAPTTPTLRIVPCAQPLLERSRRRPSGGTCAPGGGPAVPAGAADARPARGPARPSVRWRSPSAPSIRRRPSASRTLRRPPAGEHVDALLFREVALVSNHAVGGLPQRRQVLDVAGEDVGQPAGRVGEDGALARRPSTCQPGLSRARRHAQRRPAAEAPHDDAPRGSSRVTRLTRPLGHFPPDRQRDLVEGRHHAGRRWRRPPGEMSSSGAVGT